MILEICVDSLSSARAAQQGGAQRVELCSTLSEGGITPSSGLLRAVREAVEIPVFSMIRPRSGDFLYSEDEFQVMQRDIAEAKTNGADGVVLGMLLIDGRIDVTRTRELVELARPMHVTFHRAIDWAPDMTEALDQVITTGADRVLTSGGKATASQSIDELSRLVEQAADHIHVMVCGRIRKSNIAEIATATGAQEFHAALRRKTVSPATYRKPGLHLGDAEADEFARYCVVAEDVQALSSAMREVSSIVDKAVDRR